MWNINMKCKGKVKKGLGEGALWMNKAKSVFKKKYNMDVFLGTLNVELEEDLLLDEKERIEPNEYGGNLIVFVNKCIVNRSYGVYSKNRKEQ